LRDQHYTYLFSYDQCNKLLRELFIVHNIAVYCGIMWIQNQTEI